jgi:hypothetical protein
MPIAKEGWPFVLTPVGAGAVPAGLQLPAAVGLSCAFFFRDRERVMERVSGGSSLLARLGPGAGSHG